MKNIFLFLVLFFCVAIGYSQQYPVNQTLGSPTTLVTSRGGFKADSSFILPAYSDTNKANANPYVKNYAGSLIKVGNTIYVRSTDLSQWILVGSGGGTTATLQQVLNAGNSAVNTLTIRNVGNTDSIKLQSNKILIENAGAYKGEFFGNGFQSIYKPTGAFYKILGTNSNNFNNQTLLIPKTGGVLTTRVNGTLADSSGNITISTGGVAVDTIFRTLGKDSIFYKKNNITYAIKDSVGTTPTLQQVTTAGALTTNPITVPSLNLGLGNSLSFNRTGNDAISITNSTTGDNVLEVNNTPTGGLIIGGGTSPYLEIQKNPFENVVLTASTTSGIIPISVNGYTANSAGAITIPTIDTSNKFVNRLERTLGKDSIIYFVGANRFAIKDSVGTNPPASGYYGAFQDNTSQTAASINTAYAVKLNTTDLTNGVSVVNDGSSNPTRITLANTGIYNIQFSLQLEKTGGSGNMIADIWIRKNGVDIPSTTGKVVLTGSANASPVVAAWNYVLDLTAGDYIQLMWATSNTNVEIVATVATSPHPAIPSAILTVTQQAGILAGTGITAINSLTGAAQTVTTGTSGTDFAVSSTGTTHTLNLPTASATNRGALSSANWTTFNNKLGASDTLSLSSRINNKLNISDTSAMLAPYAKSNLVATKLNATDTASLSNRINLKLNIADTLTMLSKYLRKTDTASLSNRINLKLNISDTASLSNRINLKLNATDTASLSTRIETKLTNLDLLQSLSLGFKAEPYGCTYANVTSQLTLTSPRLNFYPFNWNVSDSIRGIAFLNRGTTTLTSTNYNGVAIYSLSGGTLTRLTFTANSGTFWDGTSNTWKTNAITPYYLPKGVYYLGYEASGSAGLPTIASGTIMQAGFIEPPSAVNANGIKISSFILNSTTTPPSSVAFSTTTILQQIPYFILY